MPDIAYIVFYCTDISRTRAFYEALGLVFKQERHNEGPIHWSAPLGETILELYPLQIIRPSDTLDKIGRPRMGIRCNVPYAVRTLQALGVVPSPTPEGMRAQDPDGRTVVLLPL